MILKSIQNHVILWLPTVEIEAACLKSINSKTLLNATNCFSHWHNLPKWLTNKLEELVIAEAGEKLHRRHRESEIYNYTRRKNSDLIRRQSLVS